MQLDWDKLEHDLGSAVASSGQKKKKKKKGKNLSVPPSEASHTADCASVPAVTNVCLPVVTQSQSAICTSAAASAKPSLAEVHSVPTALGPVLHGAASERRVCKAAGTITEQDLQKLSAFHITWDCTLCSKTCPTKESLAQVCNGHAGGGGQSLMHHFMGFEQIGAGPGLSIAGMDCVRALKARVACGLSTDRFRRTLVGWSRVLANV